MLGLGDAGQPSLDLWGEVQPRVPAVVETVAGRKRDILVTSPGLVCWVSRGQLRTYHSFLKGSDFTFCLLSFR